MRPDSGSAPVAACQGRACADAAPPLRAAAVEDFGAAIAAMPEYGDAWKRRGQARAALGQAGGALADFGRAVALTAEPGGRAEALAERGALLQKGRDLRRAAADLEEAARLNAGSKQVAPRPSCTHMFRGFVARVWRQRRRPQGAMDRRAETALRVRRACAGSSPHTREVCVVCTCESIAPEGLLWRRLH